MSMERADAERAIGQALATLWDPMGSHQASSYDAQAHEVYSLLARGASDAQIGRHLHQVEREQMGHPEADHRDLAEILKKLRAIEHTM